MEAARQTYPEYKNTAIPGFPSLPKHWQVARLKHLCDYHSLYGANIPASEYRDTGVRFLRTTDITDEGLLTDEGVYLPTQAVAEYILGDGDILLSRSGTVGRSFLYRHKIHGPCAYAGYLVRFVPKSHPLANYIHLFTKTTAFTEFIRTSAISSTIDNVNAEKYANCRLPLPPPDEQADIVRYLDHADELINRYIGAKERLIPLLEEQRQAVIHQAVTRGLDPNVPLKRSGVSWLGDMPRHWESPRLRYLGNAIIGLTYDPQNVTDVGGGTLVFRASNIRDGRITYEDCVYVGSRVPSLLITRPGDILICSRSGSRALIGKNAKIDVNSAGNTFGAFMTVFRSETNDYLHYVFNSNMFEHQSAMFATSTVNQLTLGMINDMKTPFPPPHEQEMIVGYLDQATAKIDQAIIQTKRQIDLTKEYRTRLIADVVTGQIDVRNATVELHV